jgi:hypothetical protein
MSLGWTSRDLEMMPDDGKLSEFANTIDVGEVLRRPVIGVQDA